MEIKKEDFESYEKVRLSGATNMFDINMVMQLSGLDRSAVMEIMNKYRYYKNLYDVEKDEGRLPAV